jgi:hypothetical protein
MNPYTVCRPRPFAAGAPTQQPPPPPQPQRPEPTGLVWSELEDVHQQILDHAAVTCDASYTQWFVWSLEPETPDDDPDDIQVQCQITWIFKRHRNNIKDAHGKLEVTIKRSLLPTQTSVWWQDLTDAEKLTCKTNLEYENTWSDVQRIVLRHRGLWQRYNFEFEVRDTEGRAAVSQAPSWAHWSADRETNARPTFADKLLLKRSTGVGRYSGDQYIYYTI